MNSESPALVVSGRGRAAAAVVAVAIAAVAIHSATLKLTGGPAADLEKALGPGLLQAPQAGAAPEAIDAARAILAREPLSPLPFLVAARAAAARGDRTAATSLFERALLRNPRNVGVRLWLADHYLRQARFGDVVAQLDAVMSIRPQLRRKLVTVLVPLVGAPTARQAVADALARNPVWQADFLDAASRDALVAPGFYELLFQLGGTRGFRLGDAQLARIVTIALARGDDRSAWTVYSRFAPRPAGDRDNRVFDADFRGAAGPPPFNWQFFDTPSGFARIEPQDTHGRLTVHTFGAQPATLAAQSMLLTPGVYQLSSAGVPNGAGSLDGLAWRLVCDRTRMELGRMAFDGSTGDRGAGSRQSGIVAIAIPALCPVATLQLVYAPASAPVLGTAVLTGVKLELVEALTP